MRVAITSKIILALLLSLSVNAQAQNARYASEQRANAAVAYYSRARTMLVEALAEYEQGKKYARADMLHDSEEFRLTLISLTEQLNKLVDPQIRITRDGIRVRANPRLIMRKSQRTPDVINGPEDGNDYGEIRRAKRIERSKLKKSMMDDKNMMDKMKESEKKDKNREVMMKEDSEMKAKAKEDDTFKEIQTTKEALEQIDEMKESEMQANADEVIKDAVEQKVLEAQEQKEAIGALNTPEEDNLEDVMEDKASIQEDAVASAIEKTIQDRLKSLELDLEN